uniref:Uncharacterized protein n=1 Tax=Erpetoichthys calabaricus TaxID=27687 RepID=A0A8C4X5S9_ERPCA
MEVAILMSVGLHISLKVSHGKLKTCAVLNLCLHLSMSGWMSWCAHFRPQPVTYEQPLPPHHVGHHKDWLTQNRNNFDNEQGAEEKTIKDVFIRKFTFGTFHTCHHHSLTDLQEVTGGIGVHGKYLLYFSTTETKSSLFTCPIKYKENMIIMLHYYDPYQPKYCKL